MSRRVSALALSALMVAALASPAAAGPKDGVPTSMCELQAFIGVQNVKECEPVE